MSDKLFPLEPSNIENIDLAMYKWLDEEINLYTNTNNGWKKVPVIWILGERAHQIKNNRDLRDEQGSFILPVITLERNNITKDLNRKGIMWSAIPEENDVRGGVVEIQKRIVPEKTSNFARTINKRKVGQLNYPIENKKVVYESLIMPLPIYVNVNYTIEIRTQFQQQMNDLVQPFITIPGGVNSVMIKNNDHKYETFIKGEITFDNNNSKLEESERLFITKINLETLGYLIGQEGNQNKPKIITRENIVDVKIPRERVVVGDISQDLKNKKLI
jgi:hypothetical protein